MNQINFRYKAVLTKSGNSSNNRIPITIIPSLPTKDRVNDLIVAQAFIDAREDFLKDGVIDYDHQSVLAKSPFEKSQAIIGQPEDLVVQDEIPVCEAFLFEKNPYVKEAILPALDADSKVWGASVGGKVLKSEENGGRFSKNRGKKITKILLKHIAITPLQKAVHGGTSVSLRKSFDEEDEIYFEDFNSLIKSFNDFNYLQKALIAGAQTDISNISGGQVIQGQSLEGGRTALVKNAMNNLMLEILAGEIKPKQYKDYLSDYKLNGEEVNLILAAIVRNKDKVASIVRKIK